MSKRKSSGKRARQTGKSRAARSDSGDRKAREGVGEAPPAHKHVPSPAAIREIIESVVVAFVLAFLFRTFEAEAFVIPTGSMAPTLMGRHKDLECPICGYQYQASASDEVNPNTNAETQNWVEKCTCPMCRYPMDLAELAAERREKVRDEFPSFKGDRILVGKFCYQFSQPERWDVAVFKYPGGAKTNFIKRLVGLPGETIQIYHGDMSVKRDQGAFSIARKPPHKLLAMLQPVFDNDLTPKITALGWPARWKRWPRSDGSSAGAWETADACSFQIDGNAPSEAWIRYEHLVPSREDWREWKSRRDNEAVPRIVPKRQLISDFAAYNTSRAGNNDPDLDSAGLHWVGDLAVQCTLEVLSDSGQAVLELVEGGWRMQCRIDLASGKATLAVEHEDSRRQAQTIDGKEYRPTAQTAVRGPGSYRIIFSNCDDQLRLWVQGSLVQFGSGDAATCYAPLDNSRPHDGSFASDLSPVGIGSQGTALRVSELKVLRDIYYIAERRQQNSANGLLTDFEQIQFPYVVLSDPSRWDAFDKMHEVEFPLGEDQFLALGDNSPKSKDGRLWEQDDFEYYVKRELLIGKALFIYWPHSWNKLPGTNVPFPLFPNVARMRFVR